MALRRVLGIDTGGTKLLGGVVDADGSVHHLIHRLWRSGDRKHVLDTMVDAVEEARSVSPEIDTVGFGIPSLVDRGGTGNTDGHHRLHRQTRTSTCTTLV